MACLLQELRRYISDLKDFVRMDPEGMSTMVANLNRTTKEGLSFSQRYLPSNRQSQFHYIICLLPEFRWGTKVAFQHCGITITWYIPSPECHIFSHPAINLVKEQTMTELINHCDKKIVMERWTQLKLIFWATAWSLNKWKTWCKLYLASIKGF